MTKRLLPLFAVLLFFSMRIFADPIHGIVVTDGNKPVPFAYVMTEGKKYATQADKEGRFTLNVPSGEYTLTAMLIGYERCTVKVSSSATTEVKMYMKEDLINLSAVTVTGTMTKKTLANTPVVTRVITAADIRKLDATNIRDVLEAELPGIEYSYAMNRQEVLKMQGLSGLSLLFLVDGERLAGETLDNVDYRRLNVDNIERIEIVKGAASALYGSNAVGAVINIITKSAADPLTVHLNTHFESKYGTQRHGAEVGSCTGRFSNLLNIQTDRMKSYTVFDKGRADSTQVYGNRQWNFKDKLVYKWSDKTSLTGKAGYYFHERNVSAYSKDRSRDFLGGLRFAGTLSEKDVLDVSYNFDRYDKSDFYPVTKKDILNYKNVQNSLRALYTHAFDKDLSLTMGGDMMANYLQTYQFVNGGSHRQFSTDIFVQADWNIAHHWNIVAGLRSDYFSGYGWQLTPKIAGMYSLNNLKVRGSYSRGFRAPTLKEMYMNFNMANVFYIYGNKDLKAETSNSFSTSAEYVHRNYCFTLTGYYNILDNEISTIWNPALDAGKGAMAYYNVEGTSLASVDATVVARYSCGFGAKLSYAYFHEFTRHNMPITSDSRPHTFTAQVDYRKTFKHYEMSVTLNGRYLSEGTYSTLDTATKTYRKTTSAAYSLWRLIVQQRLYQAVQVTLGIDNLFNYRPKVYQYNSPFTTGTSFTVGVAVELEQLFKHL